jgi:hypothetical protein
VWNVKSLAGVDFKFAQCYGISGLGTNGLCWIALSNDSLAETTSSQTLSNEIIGNGLARAQGAFTHSAGTATCTVAYTFTATGAQSCQKSALFTASSGGVMDHANSFATKSLTNGQTLQVTFTITFS